VLNEGVAECRLSVDHLALIGAKGVGQGQGGGMETRLGVLYPLILVNCRPIWRQSETVNLPSQLLFRSL
jgi:hypothetical protein